MQWAKGLGSDSTASSLRGGLSHRDDSLFQPRSQGLRRRCLVSFSVLVKWSWNVESDWRLLSFYCKPLLSSELRIWRSRYRPLTNRSAVSQRAMHIQTVLGSCQGTVFQPGNEIYSSGVGRCSRCFPAKRQWLVDWRKFSVSLPLQVLAALSGMKTPIHRF